VAAVATEQNTRELLLPYVPRLVVDWLRDTPEARHKRVEGSLAFVDISGFTKLAERLAKKGKVGAEELSDTLNSTFAELLAAAYAYGAGVIKWGGDAVLLLFEGESHELRACRGTAEMQRTIRRVGQIRTESGNVVLRMSIGVHSGAYDFFLVGESHRELLIAGESATETVALEAVADAREIVVAPSTAAALPARNIGAAKGPGFLLRGLPAVEELHASPVGDAGDLPIEHCLPVMIREHLLTTDREPEHRNIAVAFLEFRGTDDLIRSRGGEEVAEALHSCIGNVQRAVERHQVTFHETDISKDGGKILLLAGAPRSAGEDEERMLRAVRSIVDEEVALPLRVGVNRGGVFSGDFGPPYRRTFSVKGDAVNLAARLMGKADTGQIVASDDVVFRSRTIFALEELEPFFVKGKSMAITAHRLGEIHSRSGPAAGTPLIGRERELNELLEALASAKEWQGRYVEIAAEPGMGKSRLLEELRTQAERVTIVSAAGVEYESATPYFAVRTLLRTLLGLDGLDGEEAAERLGALVAELAPTLLPFLPLIALPLHLTVPSTPEVDSLEDQFRKTRLEEVVQELLGLGLLAPTILIFEDAHWMDDASRDLLGVLVDHVEDRPWLIVATTRAAVGGLERSQEWTRRIELEPLAESDALLLLEEATAESPLPPHQLELLRARAHGNPLYLRELVNAAHQLGGIEGLPDSVGGVIAAEIDRLPPTDRTALRRAAVLGSAFDERLLAAVVTDLSAIEFCNRLGDFLETSPDQIRFRHALVRDTAYEGLSYRRRRELHGVVGDAIATEGGDDADDALLSLHYYEAQRYGEAWSYSSRSGQAAKQLYANVEAQTLFERAVACARRVDDLPETDVAGVYEALGEIRLRLGDHDAGGKALREARRRVTDNPAESARLMLREAANCWRRGNHRQALRWIRRGLRTIDGDSTSEAQKHRAELYVWQGIIRFGQGRAGETIEWCRLAIEEATSVDAREALAHAYYILDYALVSLSRYDEAVYSERALAIYEETGDIEDAGMVLHNLGMFAQLQGKWEQAIERYERAEQAWERSGNRWFGTLTTENLGELFCDQGRTEEAERAFRAGLRIARAAGEASRISPLATSYARLCARTARFEEADQLLEEARRGYEQGQAHGEVLLLGDARLAERLAFEGRAKEALAVCEAALDRSSSLEGVFVVLPFLLRLRGWALFSLGRAGEAEEVLRSSLEHAREKDADYEVALTADVLAEVMRERGEDPGDLDDVRDSIFRDLGVVRPDVITLPHLVGEADGVLHSVTNRQGRR
jgi:class 3 adenylate cyclase/tetratricopeptide (TPR) repeat protein